MADTLFSHDVGGTKSISGDASRAETSKKTLTMVTNVSAAVVSLSLVAGVAVWGYKLLARDVSGIPVVRAAEGEMRVLPDDPGGVLAEHQGLAVNAVAAVGTAERPADRLLLAPSDVQLAEEDTPVITKASVEAPEIAGTAQAIPEEVVAEADLAEPSMDRDAMQAASIDAIISQLTGGPEAQEPINTSATARVVPAKVVPASATPAVLRDSEILPLATPGVAQSKRPQLRPATAPTNVVQASYSPAATREIDPAQIPAGTRLAQLGAFDSPDVARAEWDKLQTRFGDYLNGKSRVVQQAETGGRTFYRLRAMGFTDLSDARRFCSALVAEKADCIPVVSR